MPSSRKPQLRHGRATLAALLATLALAGAGQALSPAPAAALRTETCTDMGIFGTVCTHVDDGQGQGGGDGGSTGRTGGGGSGATDAWPGEAGFTNFDEDGDGPGDGVHHGPTLPDWMTYNSFHRLHNLGVCSLIPSRLDRIQSQLDQLGEYLVTGQKAVLANIRQRRALKAQISDLTSRWNALSCTEMGL